MELNCTDCKITFSVKRPQSKFNLSDRGELLKAVHYTNLQPLWELENLRKGNRVVQ